MITCIAIRKQVIGKLRFGGGKGIQIHMGMRILVAVVVPCYAYLIAFQLQRRRGAATVWPPV